MDLIQALSGFIDGNHAASDQSLQDEIPVKTSDSPLAVSAVRSPYPPCNPPGSIVDKENFMEWWDKAWQDEAGPLHKVKFRRIILDGRNHLMLAVAWAALTDISRGPNQQKLSFTDINRCQSPHWSL
jgi:hypothetical protein